MGKPNILFLLGDDYGAWAMGCAGNPEVKTPNLDRLAEHGTRFENCFCVSPVCSPARASIITGKIPSQHGIHDYLAKGHLDADEDLDEDLKEKMADPDSEWYYRWPQHMMGDDHSIHYLKDFDTYTQELADHGYECALSGKWHMGDAFHPQCGFTYWKTTAMGAENYYHAVVLEDDKMVMKNDVYITDLITDNALDFLKIRDKDRPFYLSVHYTAPHAPWFAEQHPKEYIDMYKDCPFTATPNVPPHPWDPDGRKTLDEWYSTPHPGVRFANSAPYAPPVLETWQEHRRQSLTGYYASITAMDANIGRILDQLEAEGILDDTLVIFTGDNGMSMGHHGIWGKGNGTRPVNMYDTAVKVPAIFTLPGVIKEGVVNYQMVSHYDFFETILDLAGIPFKKPDDMPGQSFAGLLTGKDETFRDSVVVYDEYGPCRMIRTDEWKLVLRYPDGPNELYDLVNDPDEEINRIDDPSCADIISSLSQRLDDWFKEYVDPNFDGSKEHVTGGGQLTSHSFR